MNQLIISAIQSEKDNLNTTDPDSVRVGSRKGSYAGYSAEIAVDSKHGLIVSSDVVAENNDIHQFAKQVNKANETLGKLSPGERFR